MDYVMSFFYGAPEEEEVAPSGMKELYTKSKDGFEIVKERDIFEQPYSSSSEESSSEDSDEESSSDDVIVCDLPSNIKEPKSTKKATNENLKYDKIDYNKKESEVVDDWYEVNHELELLKFKQEEERQRLVKSSANGAPVQSESPPDGTWTSCFIS